jgi:hypothetical protein
MHARALIRPTAFALVVSLGAFVGTSSGPSNAQTLILTGQNDSCTSTIADLLRSLQDSVAAPKVDLNTLAKYQRQETVCRKKLKAWLHLSPKQRATELQHRRELVAAQIQKWAEAATRTPPVPVAPPGLRDSLDPELLGKAYIPSLNSWYGYVDGVPTIAAGTARTDNPAQGILFVMTEGVISSAHTFEAPTTTGPLRIASESNDILTLKSLGGDYEARELSSGVPIKVVHTPGEVVYRFNLRTHQFE